MSTMWAGWIMALWIFAAIGAVLFWTLIVAMIVTRVEERKSHR